MTSAKLLKIIRSNDALISISIQDPEIFAAASLAQEDILRDYQLLEETADFSSISGQGLYTVADFDWLGRASYIVDPILYKDSTKGKLVQRDKSWIDRERSFIGESSTPAYFYVLRTNPISFGLFPIPDSIIKFVVTFGVRPTADISASSNPIIPDLYSTLFVVATLAKIFLLRGPQFSQQYAFYEALVKVEGDRIRASQVSQEPSSKLSRISWR
jgi:hypothetical protein